jgi:hypothetical protein
MGVEMRVLVRISPNFCSQTRFGLNHTHYSKQKGGYKFAPKGLSAWACLLGKNGAFLETPETRFLAITCVSGAFQYAPKACPVKFYGLEC